jgi:hypothetical protein
LQSFALDCGEEKNAAERAVEEDKWLVGLFYIKLR